jgi:hypothetical protein
MEEENDGLFPLLFVGSLGQSSEWPLGISGSMKSAYTTCKSPTMDEQEGGNKAFGEEARILIYTHPLTPSLLRLKNVYPHTHTQTHNIVGLK